MSRANNKLPISQRPVPQEPPWLETEDFLREAGTASWQTEKTYRTSLRLLADWVQHVGRDGYSVKDAWPLDPAALSTDTVIRFHGWLLANRAPRTAKTYLAAVMSYLYFLDGRDQLPDGVAIAKARNHISRGRRGGVVIQSSAVVDLDQERQQIPLIYTYYQELPLPAENNAYNNRLSLLRDRALISVLFSTAMRVSEVVALNRAHFAGRQTAITIVGKGQHARTIHIREYARRDVTIYLAERADSNAPLFVSHSRNAKGARLTTVSVESVVKRAVKALGLHRNLSAHDFRHYRATQLLREGMPIEVVQEYLGHQQITTTRGVYAPILGSSVVEEWLDNVDRPPAELAARLK
jgi:integrase/recombinase XerD